MGMTTTWVLILVAVVSDSITAPPETIILPFELSKSASIGLGASQKPERGSDSGKTPSVSKGLGLRSNADATHHARDRAGIAGRQGSPGLHHLQRRLGHGPHLPAARPS